MHDLPVRHTSHRRCVIGSVRDTTRRFLAFFLPAATVASLACLVVVAVAQHDLRQGANDPQYQLAQDAAARLEAGDAPSAVAGPGHVDVAASLDPFIAIYDAYGDVVASNGQLDGGPPSPPKGVLATARDTGRDVVTWQPRRGVRVALVVVPWHGGTVLAGRSLRRVEEVVVSVEGLVAIGWLTTMAGAAAASFISAKIWPSSADHHRAAAARGDESI